MDCYPGAGTSQFRVRDYHLTPTGPGAFDQSSLDQQTLSNVSQVLSLKHQLTLGTLMIATMTLRMMLKISPFYWIMPRVATRLFDDAEFLLTKIVVQISNRSEFRIELELLIWRWISGIAHYLSILTSQLVHALLAQNELNTVLGEKKILSPALKEPLDIAIRNGQHH